MKRKGKIYGSLVIIMLIISYILNIEFIDDGTIIGKMKVIVSTIATILANIFLILHIREDLKNMKKSDVNKKKLNFILIGGVLLTIFTLVILKINNLIF